MVGARLIEKSSVLHIMMKYFTASPSPIHLFFCVKNEKDLKETSTYITHNKIYYNTHVVTIPLRDIRKIV